MDADALFGDVVADGQGVEFLRRRAGDLQLVLQGLAQQLAGAVGDDADGDFVHLLLHGRTGGGAAIAV